MVWVRSPVYFYRRNETFYFSRAVPSDLCHRFNKKKIEVSLRTKSEAKAAKSAAALSDRLERYWDSLRMEMIYSRELGMSVVPDEVSNANQTKLSFSDALALYQRLKGTGKNNLFFKVSTRSIQYHQECLGHNKIVNLKPADAGLFRDFLFNGGMSSSSVKRVFSSVRAIMNLAIKEHGLAMTNVFNGTFIPEDDKRKERLPVPSDVIKQTQKECRDLDDEPRWLIALISDTGMRLSEACGLLTSDICLDDELPHINLVVHQWRRLKTGSSSRQIPLVGTSLWAAKQVVKQNHQFAFPNTATRLSVMPTLRVLH